MKHVKKNQRQNQEGEGNVRRKLELFFSDSGSPESEEIEETKDTQVICLVALLMADKEHYVRT